MPETAAQKVISKIEELDIPKGRSFTKEENTAINTLYKKVNTAEGKLKVKEFIENNFKEEGEARKNLLRLTADLKQDDSTETQNEVLKQHFTMETLQENTSSDIMKKVLGGNVLKYIGTSLPENLKQSLENSNKTGAFDLFIIQKFLKEGLGEDYPIINNYGENIQLIMFKRVLEKAGDSSIFESFLKKGFSSIFGNKKEGENKESDFDLTKIKEVFDDLKNFDSSDIDPSKTGKFPIYIGEGKKTEIDTPKSLIYLTNYIEKIVDNDFKNLKKLLKIAKEEKLLENEGFKALLDNPEVMDDLLKNGKTESMGYKIDLSDNKKILDLNTNLKIDTNKVKNDFMEKMTKLTDSTGKPIDDITSSARGIAYIIEEFTGYDIKEFKEILDKFAQEHPFLGGILKFFFGMVFNEGMLSELDNLDSTIKKSIENLNKLKTTNKTKLPFIIEEKVEDKEKQKEIEKNKVTNIEKFLKNTQTIEDLKQIKGEPEKVSIINNSTFWKDVLISKDSNDFLIKQIQNAVINIKKENNDITENDFFKKLSKITFKKEKIKKTTPIVPPVSNTLETVVASNSGDTISGTIPIKVKKEVNNPISLEKQIENLTELPTKIEYLGKKYKFNINSDGKGFTLGTNNYSISINKKIVWITTNIFESFNFKNGVFSMKALGNEEKILETKKLSETMISLIKNNTYSSPILDKKGNKIANLEIS